MLHRLLNSVRGLNSNQDAESFYNEVLSRDCPEAPTAEESKRDHAAMMKARYDDEMIGF